MPIALIDKNLQQPQTTRRGGKGTVVNDKEMPDRRQEMNKMEHVGNDIL